MVRLHIANAMAILAGVRESPGAAHRRPGRDIGCMAHVRGASLVVTESIR